MRQRPLHRRGTALSAASFLAGLLVSLAPAIAAEQVAVERVEVMVDFAKLMKLDKPAASVIIGNAGIADATIADPTTVILTGRAAGTTNLIIIGRDGREVANALLKVVGNRRELTTIFYGKKRSTYSCAPICEQVVAVGDDAEAFGKAESQIKTRNTFAGN